MDHGDFFAGQNCQRIDRAIGRIDIQALAAYDPIFRTEPALYFVTPDLFRGPRCSALVKQPLRGPFLRGFGAINTVAAIDLLPPWARVAARTGAQGMARVLRWALNGSASEKTARAQG